MTEDRLDPTWTYQGLPVISFAQLFLWLAGVEALLGKAASVTDGDSRYCCMVEAIELSEAIEPTGCFYVALSRESTPSEYTYADDLGEWYLTTHAKLLDVAYPPDFDEQPRVSLVAELSNATKPLEDQFATSKSDRAYCNWVRACKAEMRESNLRRHARVRSRSTLRIWPSPQVG